MSDSHWPAFVIAVAMIAGAVSMCTPKSTRAHGDAEWIASNARYVDANNMHCCGVSDCRRERAAMFRETPAGIIVLTESGGEVLMRRELVGRGLYPSIDGDWWICVRAGVVRCVFKPATGM